MTYEEALDKAVTVVDAMIGNPPTNPRGYVADGWKPVLLTERVDAILRLADFLVQQPPARVVPPADPEWYDVATGAPGRPPVDNSGPRRSAQETPPGM